MRKKWNVRGASLLAVAGTAVLAVAGGPSMAADKPANRPVAAAKGELRQEGLITLRADWLTERRQKPGDAAFDANKARLDALTLRDEQARLSAPPSGLAGTTWASIGPAPITGAQTPQDWAQSSPVSGRLTDIVIDPVDFRVYAGGAQGGVWTSDDNGATWTPRTDNLGSLAVGTIQIDPTDRNVVYLGTGEGNGSCDSYAGVGVYKSTDRGSTWSGPLGAAQFANRSINWIGIDRANNQNLVAVTASGIFGSGCLAAPVVPSRGIYKSTDGGTTWIKKSSAGSNPGSVILQDPATATRWYAAMWYSTAGANADNGGFLVSTDNGETWGQQAGTGGLPAASSLARCWASQTRAGGDAQTTIYLGCGVANALVSGQSGRVFKSTDSGVNWTALSPQADGYCGGQCFYDLPVYAEPGNTGVVYHGGAGAVDTTATRRANLRRSTDGGTTWSDVMRCVAPCTVNGGATAIHSDSHAIVTQPGSPSILWTGNDGGIWRSTDRGATWQNRNTNLAITQFTAFDVLQSDATNRSYGGTQDNGTMGWTGSGVAWPHLDYGDGGYAVFDQSNGNNLFHTYFNSQSQLIGGGCTTGGFATTQGSYGISFAGSSGTNNGISISDRVAFYAPVHADRGVGSTVYFGTHRIWRSTLFYTGNCSPDGVVNNPPAAGSAFVSLSGATDLLGGLGYFTAIETKANPTPATNADVVCGGSTTGRVFCTANATAGTPTWNERDAALPTKPYISDIAIHGGVVWTEGVSGVAYVARAGFFGSVTGNQIRKTTDGGVTWATAGTGIPDIPVNAVAIDPLVANRVWAGTDVGVYVSDNAGTSWVPWSGGLPNAAVFDLKTSPLPDNAGTANDGAILLVTHGRSGWRLTPLTPVQLNSFDAE